MSQFCFSHICSIKQYKIVRRNFRIFLLKEPLASVRASDCDRDFYLILRRWQRRRALSSCRRPGRLCPPRQECVWHSRTHAQALRAYTNNYIRKYYHYKRVVRFANKCIFISMCIRESEHLTLKKNYHKNA